MRGVVNGAITVALAATAFAQPKPPDANELLKQGSTLIATKPGEAVKILQGARKLDPDKLEIRYQLALAYYGIGDLADAAAELREVLQRDPNMAAAHNALGLVLFKLGDAKTASDEFRNAVRLAPSDANARLNLEQSEAAIIKVDVRQVLVPVAITDRQGHHVVGLTKKDFKLLEDGVEQTITSFSVEHSGTPDTATPAAPAISAPVSASKPAPRRTYVICIDTMHSSFNNFVAVREALKTALAHENSEDSQYVVIALGNTAEVVVNTTRDRAAVLAAFQGKRFQSLFLSGQQGGFKLQLDRYRRDLNETREACDTYNKTREIPPEIKCQTGMERAPREAQQVAELDRTLTIGFLRQFRFLIAQLAKARDRRTVILLSDGFQIAPGREAYDLLEAYFPDMRGSALQSQDRLQTEFEPILKQAAASNVTIDTIDSRGLYGIGSFSAANHGSALTVAGNVDRVDRNIASAEGNTLMEIAAATGGTAFHNSNDLVSGLERAFADGRDYYTVGYTSTNANADGKFRAITVQISGRDTVVNAKRGYWSERPAQ